MWPNAPSRGCSRSGASRPPRLGGRSSPTMVRDLVSLDFFTVPTVRLRVLFVLVVLAHHRRRVVHFNVTEHPTAHWTAQQLVDPFPQASRTGFRDDPAGAP